MNIHRIERRNATVQLTRDELILLNNALNEVCHGVEVPEFHARLGATPREAESLLREIGTVLNNPVMGGLPNS